MDAMENLLTRRSVRKYKKDAVPGDVLDRIIEAGTYAATAKNKQDPIIVAVTNPEVIQTLSKMNAVVLGTESDPFFGAPVCLVVLAERANVNHVYDGTLVMGNLMLACHAEGLGSCWINRAREVFDTDEGKALLKSWGVEGDYEGIGHCVLGYADEEPITKPRKENYVYYVR